MTAFDVCSTIVEFAIAIVVSVTLFAVITSLLLLMPTWVTWAMAVAPTFILVVCLVRYLLFGDSGDDGYQDPRMV